MKMKILVTGSTGYIGRSFINDYSGKYTFEPFSLQNTQVEKIDFQGIGVVLHCAALVHQKKAPPYQKYHDINVNYPINLAGLAKKGGVKQFVFISSIAVHGETFELLNEFTPCSPDTAYGKSKLEAERKLLELQDDSFAISIIRPPMVYGKNAPGNIASLVKLVKKLPILPFGGINNSRSFVYIENLCHLIDETIRQNKSGIFLASDNEPLSTTKLIELIGKSLDKKIYLLKIPFFETLLKTLRPSLHKKLFENLEINNSHTTEILNFKNPYSAEDSIQSMLEGEHR